MNAGIEVVASSELTAGRTTLLEPGGDSARRESNSKGIQLDTELQVLIGNLASHINGCDSCIDLVGMSEVREKEDLAKADAVMNYRTDSRFAVRERAALAYAEEATRNKVVSEVTFETLRKNFSEREIVEITWVHAFQYLFNLLNRPLGIGSDGLCSIASARAKAQGK